MLVASLTPCEAQELAAVSSAGKTVEKAEESTTIKTSEVTHFEQLIRYAEQKAQEDYTGSPALPADIANLSYDDYLQISYRPEKAVWRFRKPYWFEGFHRGFVHKDQVNLNVIEGNEVTRLPFESERFKYRGTLEKAHIPPETGYAGLKLLGRFPGIDMPHEILVFVGSSYFRSHSADTVYGSSVRGLAIDIGLNKTEEFPVFREFWVQQPREDSQTVTVLALMDSPSVTGAYEFILNPAALKTEIDIRSVLFFRKHPEKIGLSPLTSMWMWGDGIAPPPLEKRPAVHDADGLLVHADGKWIWRALSRQSYPSVSRIDVQELEGYGLIQRDTNYNHYHDDFAQYDRRPSVWITPTNSWPKGHMELLELPGAHEGIDNIGAYWVPEESFPLRRGIPISYRVSYFKGDLKTSCRNFVAKVQKTDLERQADSKIRFQVLFSGPAVAELSAETPLDIQIATVRGEVRHRELVKQTNGDWLMTLLIEPTSNDPVEVKAYLTDAGRVLSETWTYLAAVQTPEYQYPSIYTRIE